MPGPKKHSDETINRVKELYKQGKTFPEIGKELSLTELQIKYLVVKHIPKNERRYKLIEYDLSQLTESDKAYIAAIIDGEGSINILRVKPAKRNGEKNTIYRMLLCISNNDPRLPLFFKEKMKGKIHVHSGYKRGQKMHYGWMASAECTVNLLRIVYQYLKLKKEQADLCFEFYDTYKVKFNRKVPEEIIQIREKCCQEISKLHKKDFRGSEWDHIFLK